MNSCQIYITDVVSAIVIFYLSASPINALDFKFITWLDLCHRRNVRVPSVMQRNWLILYGLAYIYFYKSFYVSLTLFHVKKVSK